MTAGYSFLFILSTLSVDALRILKSGTQNIDDLLRYIHLEGILHNQFVDDLAKLWNSMPSYLIRIGNSLETLIDYAEQNFTLVFFSACSLLFTLFTIYRKIKAKTNVKKT
jgi:hypothetical protein